MQSERFITGQNMLQQVDGKGGDAVVESLKDIAPDFARYLIEFPFGDIYSRPGLDLRSREIATPRRLNRTGQRRTAVEGSHCCRAACRVNAGGDY